MLLFSWLDLHCYCVGWLKNKVWACQPPRQKYLLQIFKKFDLLKFDNSNKGGMDIYKEEKVIIFQCQGKGEKGITK
jgi:hypothetical protein